VCVHAMTPYALHAGGHGGAAIQALQYKPCTALQEGMAALHKANMPDDDPRPPVALSMNGCGTLPCPPPDLTCRYLCLI
jgi:hypothetical protein